MNKRDIAKIRRRLNAEKNNITCISGCYVNQDGEVISTFRLPLINMDREDTENYLALFKKLFSGTEGQNLISLSFSAQHIMDAPEYKVLTGLKDTALKDDGLLDFFLEKLRAAYHPEGTYVVLMLHDRWDIPVRLKDGSLQEDAESTLFSYILCAVCPVKLQSGGLVYKAGENLFGTRGADLIVSSPEAGFMFPAFEDGGANLYSSLWYTRKTDDTHDQLISAVFGDVQPVPADTQQQAICDILQESLQEECSFDVIQAVHEHVREKIEEKKQDKDPEPPTVGIGDISETIESCGVSPERVEAFRQQYEDALGRFNELPAVNVVTPKKFEMRTPDVVIRVSPDRSDLVETRVIDGLKYILIRAEEGVQVNGVNISIHE